MAFQKSPQEKQALNYDDEDPGFSMKYLEAVTEICPQINVDIGQAAMVWKEEKETGIRSKEAL